MRSKTHPRCPRENATCQEADRSMACTSCKYLRARWVCTFSTVKGTRDLQDLELQSVPSDLESCSGFNFFDSNLHHSTQSLLFRQDKGHFCTIFIQDSFSEKAFQCGPMLFVPRPKSDLWVSNDDKNHWNSNNKRKNNAKFVRIIRTMIIIIIIQFP